MLLTIDDAGPASPPRILPTSANYLQRSVVLVAVGAAVFLSFAVTDRAGTARAVVWSEPSLVAVLRFMAAVKAAAALATLAAVVWRLGLPVTFLRFTLYLAAATVMAAGPGLIWGLAHVGLGALLLHLGLDGCLVLLWRDPAVLSHVSDAVTRRRHSLGRI